MMKWLRRRIVKVAASQLAAALKDLNNPTLNEFIDKMDELTCIGMLEMLAARTNWKYSNGTVFEHVISQDVVAALGDYGAIWVEFFTNLQNRFDEKEKT